MRRLSMTTTPLSPMVKYPSPTGDVQCCHPPNPSLLYKKEISVKIKAEDCSYRQGYPPKPATTESFQKKANRHRQSQRPSELTDLEFEVNQNYMNCEDCVIADLRVDRERHILFSTPRQLEILRSTKRFKVRVYLMVYSLSGFGDFTITNKYDMFLN
ncbi:hypothetical protein DPMN_193924 [Dreissena polymorpha]|uniref:Uncharacterized protein n=1 Tax=Dreissena polymorpha TaxID=45954 RepID=A0A9D3Y1B1_DREPO|nr:hypothetical protein DPMN_193924 [Dreissena polymorpha]